jgi:hypothetical protein
LNFPARHGVEPPPRAAPAGGAAKTLPAPLRIRERHPLGLKCRALLQVTCFQENQE